MAHEYYIEEQSAHNMLNLDLLIPLKQANRFDGTKLS